MVTQHISLLLRILQLGLILLYPFSCENNIVVY